MSLSDNYPDIRALWMNDYANAGVIDPRCSFARSDSTPSNVHYWSDEDHLSSENLILQSENFTTTWAIQDASGAAGATAPDGGTDGYTVTAYTGSSKGPRASQSLSGKLSTSTEYTMVGHVKAGTATHGYISFRGNNVNNYAYAQIQFSSPGSVSTGGAGFSGISGTVTALGSSWYRLTLTATTGSDVSGAFAFLGVNDGTAFGISGYPIWTSAGETLEVWGAQLSTTQAKTYDSPTTTQIHREYAATLKSVAYSGQPRFEYEPTGDREAKGLLIESQVTNLAPYAKNGYDASNALQWGTTQVVPTENAAVAPSGNLEATLIQENTGTGQHNFSKNIYASATAHTFSFYVKDAGVGNIGVRFIGSTNIGRSFNLTDNSTGAFYNVPTSYGIEDVGNGWKRVHITATLTAANWSFYIYCFRGAGSVSYSGDGYSGFLFYGAQLEANSSPSSWVDTGTSGSTSTRTRDQLSVATADIGFEGGPLTLLAESTTETDTLNPVTFHVYKNGDHQISLNAKSDNNRAAYIEADNSYSTLTSAAVGNGVRALRVDTNDIATALNGTIDATDTSQTLPDLTGATMYIGDDSNGGNSIDGHIKRVALYSEALTDTELQSLTS